jgi:hypothetical protein
MINGYLGPFDSTTEPSIAKEYCDFPGMAMERRYKSLLNAYIRSKTEVICRYTHGLKLKTFICVFYPLKS